MEQQMVRSSSNICLIKRHTSPASSPMVTLDHVTPKLVPNILVPACHLSGGFADLVSKSLKIKTIILNHTCDFSKKNATVYCQTFSLKAQIRIMVEYFKKLLFTFA